MATVGTPHINSFRLAWTRERAWAGLATTQVDGHVDMATQAVGIVAGFLCAMAFLQVIEITIKLKLEDRSITGMLQCLSTSMDARGLQVHLGGSRALHVDHAWEGPGSIVRLMGNKAITACGSCS